MVSSPYMLPPQGIVPASMESGCIGSTPKASSETEKIMMPRIIMPSEIIRQIFGLFIIHAPNQIIRQKYIMDLKVWKT